MSVESPLHGGVGYLEFLRIISEELRPQSYFEIGTGAGESLGCFSCDAVAVDPNFKIAGNFAKNRSRAFFFQMTSDQFFRAHSLADFLPGGPDVAFLDGLHRFEFLLRDLINTERSCHSRSMIILHDCLPTNERMAERQQRLVEDEDISTRWSWTGDVWRIIPALKKYRPELRVHLLDCPPTGLVVCTNLNPQSTVLANNYYSVVDEFFAHELQSYDFGSPKSEYPIVSTHALREQPWNLTSLFTVR